MTKKKAKGKAKAPKASHKANAPRRHLFPAQYVIDRNATQAAIRCGYSARTARAQGSRLLTDVYIRAEIDRMTVKQEETLELTADMILREIMRTAFVDLGQAYDEHGNLLPIAKIPEDVRRSLSGVEVDEIWEGRGEERAQTGVTRKVKLLDKLRALELLGKHKKLFIDRVDHTSGGKTLEELIVASWAVAPLGDGK